MPAPKREAQKAKEVLRARPLAVHRGGTAADAPLAAAMLAEGKEEHGLVEKVGRRAGARRAGAGDC